MPRSYHLQVLEKANYRKQHILPFDEGLPPLSPSSVRVQSKIIALTTNNLSYARVGDALHWYDAHPLPFTEGPFSNPTKFGRTNAWGTGEVIESTADFLPVGTRIWGYLPLADLPIDKQVKPADVPGSFVETTKYRQQMWPIYNFYSILDPSKGNNDQYNAYAALTRVLFETAYSLNRMAFGWNPEVPPTNPFGLQISPKLDTWTQERADLRVASVVIMPASSKTAFAFAYVLRHARPEDEQPRTIVGATSANSRHFCNSLELYDSVVDYGDIDGDKRDTIACVDSSRPKKIVLLDFGARPGVKDKWLVKLEASTNDFTLVRVGGAIPEGDDEGESAEAQAKIFVDPAPNQYPSNAGGQRDAGINTMARQLISRIVRMSSIAFCNTIASKRSSLCGAKECKALMGLKVAGIALAPAGCVLMKVWSSNFA